VNSERDFVPAIRLNSNNFILGVKGGVVKRMGDVERGRVELRSKTGKTSSKAEHLSRDG